MRVKWLVRVVDVVVCSVVELVEVVREVRKKVRVVVGVSDCWKSCGNWVWVWNWVRRKWGRVWKKV